MLNNKAEAAFSLLSNKADVLNVPEYIKQAIEWITFAFICRRVW